MQILLFQRLVGQLQMLFLYLGPHDFASCESVELGSGPTVHASPMHRRVLTTIAIFILESTKDHAR